MSDPTIPTTPEPATPAGELHRLYADRWDIARVTLEVWVATYRSADGSHIRVLAGPPSCFARSATPRTPVPAMAAGIPVAAPPRPGGSARGGGVRCPPSRFYGESSAMRVVDSHHFPSRTLLDHQAASRRSPE